MLLTALALALAPTPAEIRLREAEGISDQYLIPGADLSDDAARKVASRCGETAECLDRQINSRETLRHFYSRWPNRRSAVLKAVQQNTESGVTDWYWALSAFEDTLPKGTIRTTVSCRTTVHRRYASSTCWTY